VRCVYSATRDYSAMPRWAAVSFASPPPPLSHQRRAPTSLPDFAIPRYVARSIPTLREVFLAKSGADANGFFRTDFHRYARYFSPIYIPLSALRHTHTVVSSSRACLPGDLQFWCLLCLPCPLQQLNTAYGYFLVAGGAKNRAKCCQIF
jgi:hypothetical protein